MGVRVTSPPESTPPGQILRPLRDLATYALVGAVGVWLLVAIIDLIPDGSDQFGGRTEASFGNFVNLPIVAFPIAAVLLALMVQPRHPKARLVVLAALIEYAVAAFFGVFFGLLVGLINVAADAGARAAFEGLLTRLAWLAVLAVAAYGVFLIWQRNYMTPKPPAPAPGVYGQPATYNPGAFPGRPGFGPPPGAPMPGGPYPGGPVPGGPHQGGPMPGGPVSGGPVSGGPVSGGPPGGPVPGGHPGSMPPAPGTYGPTTYGQAPPPPNPSWNQPATPMHPHGSPPFQPPGSPAAPQNEPPSAPPPFSEPTQVVPQQPAEERTEKLDEPRPGFGAAEPDPPRS
jgi:hypothetical protein